MNILFAILTTRDAPRLDRAVRSVLNTGASPADIVIVVNSLDSKYHDEADAVGRKHDVPRVHTVCNGKPGRGKNSVLDVLLNNFPEYTHVLQIDGDDYLWPTALQAVSDDVLHDPDALMVAYQIIDLHAERLFWSNGLAFPKDQVYGPGTSTVFDEAQPTCWWMPRLFSRAGARLLRFNEDLDVAEDHLMMLDATQLHRERKGRTWVSRSSDVYCIDRSGDGRTQVTAPDHDWGPKLRECYSYMHRTSPWELPIIWSDPMQTWNEKNAYADAMDNTMSQFER